MATTRLETLDFLALAPVRATARREMDASPTAIFDALADTASWPQWFPDMEDCRWLTPGPHGVDSQREVRVGPLHVVERFIVWDRPRRWGFSFTAARPPVARAGVELVELEPVGAGTTAVTYTMALEPSGPSALVSGVTTRALEATLADALAGLEGYLTG